MRISDEHEDPDPLASNADTFLTEIGLQLITKCARAGTVANSAAALDTAIRVLDYPGSGRSFGDPEDDEKAGCGKLSR